jgi:hypothetical protein
MRFEFDDIVILCETKNINVKLGESETQQIKDYIWSEREDFDSKKIIAILINGSGDIKV